MSKSKSKKHISRHNIVRLLKANGKKSYRKSKKEVNHHTRGCQSDFYQILQQNLGGPQGIGQYFQNAEGKTKNKNCQQESYV